MSAETKSILLERFPMLAERESGDHPAYNCPPGRLIEVARYLRDEADYDLLMDVTAIDWEDRSPRFSTVYHFYTTSAHAYLRIVCDLDDDEDPAVPSLVGLWAGADWHERETYDMFGIRFEGHPDLRRILMWDGYPYFPLRKEFPLAGIETELPGADVAEETGASVLPAPMMGGPFVAKTSGPMSKAEPRAKDESWTEKMKKPVQRAPKQKNG